MDTLTPDEIRQELLAYLPRLSKPELEKLTEIFVRLAGGKYLSGRYWLKNRRNEQIRRAFRGQNIAELARLFSLSTSTIRRVLKKVAKRG